MLPRKNIQKTQRTQKNQEWLLAKETKKSVAIHFWQCEHLSLDLFINNYNWKIGFWQHQKEHQNNDVVRLSCLQPTNGQLENSFNFFDDSFSQFTQTSFISSGSEPLKQLQRKYPENTHEMNVNVNVRESWSNLILLKCSRMDTCVCTMCTVQCCVMHTRNINIVYLNKTKQSEFCMCVCIPCMLYAPNIVASKPTNMCVPINKYRPKIKHCEWRE